MANRGDIKTSAKKEIGRNYTGIEPDLDEMIDIAVELFGNTISDVYDEQRWTHSVTSGDVTAKTDNWVLPSTVKHLLTGVVIDDTGTEKIFFPMEKRSPLDSYNYGDLHHMDAFITPPSFNYAVDAPTRASGYIYGGRVGRINTTGIPKFFHRLGANVFVFPRPGTTEINWEIEIMLGVYPATLTADSGAGSTNTITDKHPKSLASYSSGLLWSLKLHNMSRAQSFFNVAALLLQSYASAQEIDKLMNIPMRRARK